MNFLAEKLNQIQWLSKILKCSQPFFTGISAGVGSILLGCLAFFFWLRCKKVRSPSSTLLSRNISPEPSSKPDVEKGGSMLFSTPIFKYDELVEATENFDSSKELGDGGFGTVYHGEICYLDVHIFDSELSRSDYGYICASFFPLINRCLCFI